MRNMAARTRVALWILAALLALPLAPAAFPVEAKKRPRTVTRTFRNAAPMTLPIVNTVDLVSASPYPSTIAVSGLKGKIRDVNLRLNNLTHAFPADVYALLVGPSGQYATVMGNVGGQVAVAGVTLRLDDEAKAPLPAALDTMLRPGTFRPTNASAGVVPFNAPAPPVTSANAALSVFDGTDPNGAWRLFVMDVYGPAYAGALADGWALEITTKGKGKKKR